MRRGLEIPCLELREFTQPPWRQDPEAASPQRDQTVAPQGLQNAVHVDARQGEGVGQIPWVNGRSN